MIQKMMESIYEGFTEALWRLGYVIGQLVKYVVFTVLVFTVPLWALPYWIYHRRRGR